MMAKYRIRKCSKGDNVWFTAERRYAIFLWTDVAYGRHRYETADDAHRAIRVHKNLVEPVKKELVIKL